ncbi:MAG: hypothetical protein MRERV_20c019 [Mycoplasmataceae bacterium RV_VA103A]|nr:MAG: hypothetical protein MRERV_20c019 [Mycoplasmataceae bacterium RV_VA103A]
MPFSFSYFTLFKIWNKLRLVLTKKSRHFSYIMDNKTLIGWYSHKVEGWEKLIRDLVEERNKKIKEEVIEASSFLPLVTNNFDESKDLDEIEEYYQQKLIYPMTISNA